MPIRQTAWVGGQIIATVLTALLTLGWASPSLAIAAGLGVGASLVDPRRISMAPLVVALVLLSGVLFGALGLPIVMGASLAAGGAATALMPHRKDPRDLFYGATGTAFGTATGLWIASVFLPAGLPAIVSIALTATAVGVLASAGMVPVAIRHDRYPAIPATPTIRTQLHPRYHRPVYAAVGLYRAAQGHVADVRTRRGLAEIASWVYRLQVAIQVLDRELDAVDPIEVGRRIVVCEQRASEAEPVARHRWLVAAQHLRRLLEQRRLLETERERHEALVAYAIAFLENARAGLAVARHIPDETVDAEMQDVLHRLRAQLDAIPQRA